MLAIEIEDIKKFMSCLLIENCFDSFFLVRAEIKTAVSYEIDGKQNASFYDTDEREAFAASPYIRWGEIKPVVMNMIKGKRLPVKMKISLLGNVNRPEFDYNMNVLYENGSLKLVTNVSSKQFSLEKPDEGEWNRYIIESLKKNGIAPIM
ncbi:MAG: DUF5721 family protein [Lachnospiraceae bacterium]|nr:DUF5721 family protein [Lachnospiraceae bacterium]